MKTKTLSIAEIPKCERALIRIALLKNIPGANDIATPDDLALLYSRKALRIKLGNDPPWASSRNVALRDSLKTIIDPARLPRPEEFIKEKHPKLTAGEEILLFARVINLMEKKIGEPKRREEIKPSIAIRSNSLIPLFSIIWNAHVFIRDSLETELLAMRSHSYGQKYEGPAEFFRKYATPETFKVSGLFEKAQLEVAPKTSGDPEPLPSSTRPLPTLIVVATSGDPRTKIKPRVYGLF